jgi:hypothetical protein
MDHGIHCTKSLSSSEAPQATNFVPAQLALQDADKQASQR